jgi:PAS domain-containing protein
MAKTVPARMPGRREAIAALEPIRTASSESPGQPGATDPTLFECNRAFAHSRHPVLIVDGNRGVVVHANTAACRVVGARRTALVGAPLHKYLHGTEGCDFRGMLLRVRPTGTACFLGLRAVSSGKRLDASVSLVRSAGQDYLLLRPRAAQMPGRETPAETSVSETIDGASMGFVVTDGELTILYANPAFVCQAGLADEAEAIGCSLSRWIGFSDRDLARLKEQMMSRESVISVMTRLTGEHEVSRLVHLLAVAVPDGPHSHWGFVLTGRTGIN